MVTTTATRTGGLPQPRVAPPAPEPSPVQRGVALVGLAAALLLAFVTAVALAGSACPLGTRRSTTEAPSPGRSPPLTIPLPRAVRPASWPASRLRAARR
jgi:hypothetical protein